MHYKGEKKDAAVGKGEKKRSIMKQQKGHAQQWTGACG